MINSVALVCMIASGTVLPLMDVAFGQFVNIFTNFVTGQLSPAGYREKVDQFRHVVVGSKEDFDFV